MTRERRSIWGSVSTSKKVNALSSDATILWFMSIPHFDDQGFMDGDPRLIKSQILPLKNTISVKKIPKLIAEITTVHEKIGSLRALWRTHYINDECFIEDCYFNDKQIFKGIHRQPSKIKELLKSNNTLRGVSGTPSQHPSSTPMGDDREPKLSEVKRREEKLREKGVLPNVEISTQNAGDGSGTIEGAHPSPMEVVKKLAKQKQIETPTEKEIERKNFLEKQAQMISNPEQKEEEVPFK